MESTDSFYMTLPSSASMDLYPRNSMNHYTTDFYKPISLDRDQFEVGLCEFQLEGHVFNIEEDKVALTICRNKNEILKISNALSEHENNVTLEISEKKYRITKEEGQILYVVEVALESGYYRDEFSVMENLNTNLRKNILTRDLEFQILPTTTSTQSRFIMRLRSTIGLSINTSSVFRLYMSARLSYGLEKFVMRKTTKNNNITNNNNDNIYTFEVKLHKLVNHPKQCFIYSNIVNHQIVGSDHLRLLRIVFLPNNDGGICITYDTPHYMKISVNEINNLNIYIKDIRGLPFQFSHGSVIVKLHFRPRQ